MMPAPSVHMDPCMASRIHPSRPVLVEPLAPSDLAALTALSQAVAWPHRADDLSLLLALGRGRVARERAGDDVAAGVAMWWPWGEDAATLGMVIVDPARQGQGIGRRLVEAVLADIGPRPVRLNATEAGAPLYAKLGFRPCRVFRQHQGDVDVLPAMAGARLAEPAERAALGALDAAAFGAPRQGLVDRLLAEGEFHVLPEPAPVRGFAVRRRFGRGQLIGPLVAPDEAHAIALLEAALVRGFVRIDVDANASALGARVEALGMSVVDTVVEMVRGDWPGDEDPSRPRRLALAAQALG